LTQAKVYMAEEGETGSRFEMATPQFRALYGSTKAIGSIY
jgi:hypothetical protein